MAGTFEPNKFKYLSDPPVVTQPFSLIIDEEITDVEKVIYRRRSVRVYKKSRYPGN